jgi:hypothetical protein
MFQRAGGGPVLSRGIRDRFLLDSAGAGFYRYTNIIV